MGAEPLDSNVAGRGRGQLVREASVRGEIQRLLPVPPFQPVLPPAMAHKQIYYSDKYFDEQYEYRHVMLPRELSKQVPKSHLMSEEEWRRLGVQQSLGWVHYMIHEPEPHILLFRRPLPKDEQK
ncbi:cyclin-dependent kinases regulatory subunit 2 [Chamaea fasciata]|uniref:cyclin-dependent kinases regulatory subunit 2 n=1 Tax=Chamaea fasciata TaxID=190680 RepID=UPI00336A5D05